jgi:PAS domain-containing protein
MREVGLVQGRREYAENIVATVREPLIVLNVDLTVDSANRSFYHTFQVTPSEIKGHLLYDLGNGQWNIPRLREVLEKILPEKSVFNDFEWSSPSLSLGDESCC